METKFFVSVCVCFMTLPVVLWGTLLTTGYGRVWVTNWDLLMPSEQIKIIQFKTK